MPDVSFAVPDWIKPPSEAEQARIDEAAAAASRNAYSMIRRGIGMGRLEADTRKAIAEGIDPVTARQNALLNNARFLFEPNQIADLVQGEQANRIRERALNQSQSKLALEAQHYSNLAENAKAALAERAKYHEDTLAQKKAAAEKANAEFPPSIVAEINPVTGKPVAILRKSRGTAELVEPKTASKLTEVDKSEIRSIYSRIKELQKAHDDIEPEQGAVKERPNQIKRMKLNLEITKLKDRAKEIESKAKGEDGATEDTQGQMPKDVQEGTIIKQGNKRFYKIPGDPNDPDSWVEVAE